MARLAKPEDRLLSAPVLLRLYLLVAAPAVFWIALAGWLGVFRLEQLFGHKDALMATPVAALLLLAAVALGLAVFVRWRPQLMAWLAAGSVIMANLGEHFTLWWQGERDTLLHAATVLVLIALPIVLWFARPHNQRKQFTFGTVATTVAVSGALVSVVGAFVLVERDIQQVQRYVNSRAQMVVDALELSFVQPVTAMQRLADRWDVLSHAPEAAYVRQEGRSYIRDYAEINRISLLNESGELLRDIHQGNETQHLLEDARLNPAFESFLIKVREQGHTRMSLPGLVPDHPEMAFVAAPLSAARGGFILATVDMSSLVQQAFTMNEPPCCFSVRAGEDMFYQSEGVRTTSVALVRVSGSMDDMFSFLVTFWKEDLPGEVGMAYYPLWALVLGLVFTASLALSQGMAREAQQRARALYRHSHSDLLTDLPNRRMLRETLNDWFATQQQPAGLSLVFVELRGLRLINDSLGHSLGDKLIQAAAVRLRDVIPKTALLARLDGAEFVAVMSRQDEDQLTLLAEAIFTAMSAPIDVGERELLLSAVIGMASSEDSPGEDTMELVRKADLAMLQAKKQVSSMPWAYYTDAMGEEAAVRVVLAQDLKKALDAGELNMVYQPLVDTHTGQIASMESLVRWKHHDRGFISPAVFIPMAEESGQILDLTIWTLRRACEDAVRMGLLTLPRVVPFAVNISPLCFQRDDFLEQLMSVLETTGVPPRYLQIEVTEGLMLHDRQQTIEKLKALAQKGIYASLDDFGTGYSSLSHLRDLPVRKIKLDRSFIVEVTQNDNDARIVQGLVTIVHRLGMTVVVEGVETAPQARLLTRLGCDQIQGYFFSRPLEPQNMATLLQNPPDYLAQMHETPGDKTSET